MSRHLLIVRDSTLVVPRSACQVIPFQTGTVARQMSHALSLGFSDLRRTSVRR